MPGAQKPLALLWLFPSRGTCVSNVPGHQPPRDNPLPVEVDTPLRCADMLGVALRDRTVDGIPLGASSVAVRCTFSLSRFPKLDTEKMNVWHLSSSQVLTGSLLEESRRNPESFLRKFMALEEQLRHQRVGAQRLTQPQAVPKRKRPPGKRRSK